MKLCFPVQTNSGMDSHVYNHFGSAPDFVIVETESGSVMTIGNRDLNHVHGACNPVLALNGEDVDAVIVGGIGGGAINKLSQNGIKVFRAAMPTIRENIELYKTGGLKQFSLNDSCSAHGHGNDHVCGH